MILILIYNYISMGEIFKFLIKPTKTTESLILKDDKSKIIIIWTLLFLYSLTTVWNTYFGLMWSLFDTMYYIKLFFYNIISYIIFIGVVFGIWKVFSGKAKYLDVLFVTMLSQITLIIVNIIFIIVSLSQSISLMWMTTFISIPAVIWFLVVWSKWLSKIEQFSETKVTFTVILSIVALYFWNSFLSWITWMSIL
jgi:hypothetical protein